MKNYTYSINGSKVMTIYENNAVLATIEDCDENNKAGCETLFKDIVYELRNIDLNQDDDVLADLRN